MSDDYELIDEADRIERALPVEYKTWLAENRSRPGFADLASVILDTNDCFFGMRFKNFVFDRYAEELARIDRSDLVGALLETSNEWRADNVAKSKTRKHLGVAEKPMAETKLSGIVAEMPLPVVSCRYRDPMSGRECTDAAMPGAIRCRQHGGDWLDPRIRQNLLMAAYMKLVEATEVAVDTLVWVAVNGRREEARVLAAKEILDRAGIRAGIDIHVVPDPSTDTSQVDALRARLATMADGMRSRDEISRRMSVVDDNQVVDAEVIEEE